MSDLKVKGKIEKILEVEKGTSKAGKDWKKQSFILNNGAEWNNLFCFELFGDEKVENLTKYNKVGDEVEVSFNVKCNEWKGKYFTSLDAWKVFKSGAEEVAEPVADEEDSMPF